MGESYITNYKIFHSIKIKNDKYAPTIPEKRKPLLIKCKIGKNNIYKLYIIGNGKHISYSSHS